MSIKQQPVLELRLRDAHGMREALAALPADQHAEVSPVWLAQIEAAVEPDPWLHGFSAVVPTGEVVGQGAFKGPPEDGIVEIAYAVEPAHEGRGYASAIAAGLVAFAFEKASVQIVRAHTLPGSAASIRALEKSCFRFVGEAIDSEDGVVLCFEKRKMPE